MIHTHDETQTEHLLSPREVASLFHVEVKTVARWANEGKLTTQRTMGGHRRFSSGEVARILAA